MTTISKDNDVVTLITSLRFRQRISKKLADMLIEATEKTMKNLPGFVSANIHKSADGVRVANYALAQA